MLHYWENLRAQKEPRTQYYIDPVKIIWQSDNSHSVVEHAELLLTGRDGQAVLRYIDG
ncbi:hypothetical protein SAMN04487969_1278 [Paenibacillus algorifonticola]|uniref:Uncharacterized protein n=1 Tax=Paenibacillus algorifonticola TaxID=684063 RepID=A0A1I2HXQ1_9BACL|nr:hypothetical protein SAMN04487969_1278 [Paenibacillus algorifonticola]